MEDDDDAALGGGVTRSRLPVAALVALLLLAAGHWLFWYRPRSRPGVSDPASLAGRLFERGSLPYRVWVPYPHQNLSQVDAALGDTSLLLRSVAELTGRPLAELPSFGAVDVPPASEMSLAVDESGDRFVAVARVYPVAGLLARWAGRLAGNPLLSGGRAELGGRELEVSWEQGNWVVRTPGLELPAAAGASTGAAGGEGLVWFQLDRRRGRVPPGRYRLDFENRDLVVEGGDPRILERLDEIAARPAPLPLLTVETSRREGKPVGRALGLIPGVSSLASLPGAASAASGSKRWRLPGERLLDALGDGAPRRRMGAWRLVALDDESLELGVPMVEFARRLQPEQPHGLAVWVEIHQARRLVDQVADALEMVPIIGRREARKWRRVSAAIEPLMHWGRLTAMISQEPPALRARLEPVGESD